MGLYSAIVCKKTKLSIILACLFLLFAFSGQAQELSENSVPSNIEQATAELLQNTPLMTSETLLQKKAMDPFDPSIETTLFDVYLGDKLKGAVLADYTDDWLLISEPQELIDQLKDIKDGARLTPLLTGKIMKRRQIDQSGSVRFNLNTFSIIIDVSPELLDASALDLKKRIGKPEQAPTLQQRVSVISSGSANGNTNSAFSHRGIASYGEFFAIAEGAVVSDRPYELNQATAGGIIGDYRATAGLLQTQGNPFSPSLQYSGIKFETAEELFLDQDLIRGSQFQIFVPSRSRVEFYRDGRLISTQVLDFGLREVDTSSFPQGSYDVDIVIIDSFGNATRQRKFFTKAGFLSSRSQPVISAQVGSIRDNLDTVDVPVYQTGIRWRAADIFDLSASIYGSEDLHIGTMETIGLYRNLRFSLGISESNEGDRGILSSVGTTILGTSIFLNHTKTLEGGEVPEIKDAPDEQPFDPIFDLPNRRTSLIFQDRFSNSYTISRRFGDFNIRYVNEKSSGEGTPSRYSKGAYLEWILKQDNTQSLRFQSSILDTDRGDFKSAGLLYGYRVNRNLTLGAQLARHSRDTGDETVIIASVGYDAKDRNEYGERGLFTSEFRERKNDATGTVTSINNQVNLDSSGDYAQVLGFVRDSRTSNRDNTSYGISAVSSFLVASDASVSVSHPVNREAVFLAEVNSNTTETIFEVLLNDQVAGTVPAGSKKVIALNPYRTYEVRVRPTEDGDLVTYDSNASRFTVFPGNVIKRSWQAEKVFILLGRILDQYGEPVARKRIRGTKEYTVTEEDGTFQAEIGGHETLTIDSPTHNCSLSFDIQEHPEYFLDIGDLLCNSY